MKQRSILTLARQAHRLGQPRRWAPPAIIGTGLLAALLEGAGLVLFIPLLQSLGAPGTGAGGMLGAVGRAFEAIPASQRTAWLVAILCLIILANNAVNLANTGITRHMDGDVAHRLRTRIFEQTLSSCIDYRPGFRRADIASTLSTNSWRVASALALFYRIAVSTVTIAVFLAFMTAISARLTLCALLFMLLAAAIMRAATRRADTIGQEVVRENKEFGLRMWEGMHSLQLIRAFGREPYEEKRFRSASDRVRRRLLSLDLLWALPGSISEVAIVVLIGGLILAADRVGVGIAALAGFLSLLYRLQGPVRELMQSKVAVDGLAASVEDVAEFLDASKRPHLADGTRPAPALRTGIVFRNVSFRYAADEPRALSDVSFTIPAGRTTAIVGRSGAGKSTIFSLLLRFHDPEHGEILVEGEPLPSLRLAEWRSRLSLMSQDVQMFNDTIAANIGYGRADATCERIARAAAIAHADEFITTLPHGYETVVGDHGLRLSGGQRQRIALARAVLRDPDLLLLDEATNALDAEAEQAFQQALERYSHDRTVVVIAHRLSTVRNADKVIVMGGGRVLEQGPPGELIRDTGVFARMLDLQQGRQAPVARERV